MKARGKREAKRSASPLVTDTQFDPALKARNTAPLHSFASHFYPDQDTNSSTSELYNNGGSPRMNARRKTSSPPASTPEAQLRDFIAKFDPENQKLIRAVRRKIQTVFPKAFELVYDNYNFFVIGYSPTERPSDAIVSITANSSGVGLCFIQGASLPDPDKLLLGSGVQTRFIRVPSPEVLDTPGVVRLLKAAQDHSKVPSEGKRGKLIIRSVSAKQRPRRKK